jgi:hypothetical protein
LNDCFEILKEQHKNREENRKEEKRLLVPNQISVDDTYCHSKKRASR